MAVGFSLRVGVMRRLWFAFVLLYGSALPALAQDWLADRVDPDDLSMAERRVLQAALVVAGEYLGPVDGMWNAEAAEALASYAAPLGHKVPLYRDVIPLLGALEQERQARDWQVLYFEDADTSLALPAGLLTLTEDAEGFAWEAADGSLSASFDLETPDEAMVQHRLIYSRRADGADRYQLIEPARVLTSVTLKDGLHAFARADQVGGVFASLVVLADDARYTQLALMGLSLARGQMADFSVPEGGVLAALASGQVAQDMPVRRDEPPVREDLSPKDAESTGSGFYVNAANIVTAAHVVQGCKAMSLTDGSPVGVVLADDDLDLAVLAPAEQSDVWLNLLAEVKPRLGETRRKPGNMDGPQSRGGKKRMRND